MKKKLHTVMVSLCENDARGDTTFAVRAITVATAEGRTLLRLQPAESDTEPVWQNDAVIILYGFRVKYLNVLPWSGGVLWNRYEMPLAYALGLILVLAESGRWKAHDGRGRVRRRFSEGKVITSRSLGFADHTAPLIINPAQGALFSE